MGRKTLCKNGFNDLEKLSADAIFPNVMARKYLQWDKDKINKVLAPLDKASELEKAYYYRYMQFVATEHMLSKSEIKRKTSLDLQLCGIAHCKREKMLAIFIRS